MTVTSTPPLVGVDDLDPAGLLACVHEAEAAERAAALRKLELAVQWCVLHPATDESGAAVWGDAGLPGLSEGDETLGGAGCPLVASFAPEPFAAALGVSTLAGMQLLADALDLSHRLPRTWARVQRLEVPAWKARRVAQATHHLTPEAAARVDAHVGDRVGSCGSVVLDRLIAQAAAAHDPEAQADRERAGRDAWDVRLTHRTDGGWAGTSHLEATGDTRDLTGLYGLVCDHAAQLAAFGDPDSLGARKAKALAAIANTQTALDLTGDPSDRAVQVRRTPRTITRCYLHLRLTDLLGLDGAPASSGVGEVERLGPATIAKIRDWLGPSPATIVPVLDLARDEAVDQHDPPAWMREVVILRDRHCIFPWCGRDARACDLDHIDPYVPLDRGGPPSQTAPANLAPLCRRHHRAKTTGRWRYRRRPDGTYLWHGPYGATYLVTSYGTRTLRDA